MADYYLCGWGQVLHAVVPAGVRGRAGTRNAVFVQVLPREHWPAVLPKITVNQKRALDVLLEHNEPVELAKLAKDLGCGPAAITALISKGYAQKLQQRVERLPVELAENTSETPSATGDDQPLSLNAEQQAVWAKLEPVLQRGGHHTFLLHGVTGSGKTELYLQAIEAVLRQGKEVIVLVPEISLTPQTLERFRGRCGKVAVLHSHLSDAERASYWRHVAAGKVQVVVGARSAVFAPTRNLGLIVIDEEHENSFKQDTTPRYHARDVALTRARLADVPILLGSATPSLESWHAAQQKQYTLLSMLKRVENRPMPRVQLIDMRHEPRTPGQYRAIGPTLEQGIRHTLKTGGQVILLLNRRGFSTHVHCPTCGYVSQCQHCDLALTFHRQKAMLLCHYCGYEAVPMTQCPNCTKGTIRYQGLGTEKLQAELDQLVPAAVVQRMDSDTMSKSGSHQRVLDAFRDGQIQILLGTQMIAKGLDFPNVTLVGVVNADTGLHLPDFRAAERTFQLLAQVAGRAGRGDKGGVVMVQSYSTDHPCVMLAAQHDYLGFAKLELGFRAEHQYPPYQQLARLIIRSENETAAGEFAQQLAGVFKVTMARQAAQHPVRLLGPAECPVYKLHDNYRFHFQLQCASTDALHGVLREVLTVAKPPNKVEYQVDIDPLSMM
jgi:primosomal protein N' (replication factor Y)